MPTQIPNKIERLGAVTAYLTLGVWGLIWLLISRTPAFNQKDFVRFHCFQSIFIGILYMFIPSGIEILFNLIIQLIAFFPQSDLVINLLKNIHSSLQAIIHLAGLALIAYCVVFCVFGKYTNIPWVSQMINRMLR